MVHRSRVNWTEQIWSCVNTPRQRRQPDQADGADNTCTSLCTDGQA